MDLNFIRLRSEQNEHQFLAPYAAFADQSAGRTVNVPEDPIRTCFQRDRDRILHSKCFRRLKHKTQVFLAPKGDHFRTRLTHTLEVAQISRTVSRALRLNEDLTEAIALGHDVGHPPFGHAGEAALDQALQTHFEKTGEGPGSFRHYEQSYRLLVEVEKLNLSAEVLNGIHGHSKGEKDLTADDGIAKSSLESAVVRICDRIAYLNHDLDDAIRSGFIDAVPSQFAQLGGTHGHRINAMVTSLIAASEGLPEIRLPDEMLATLNELKDWLFQNVYYRYPIELPEINKAKNVVIELFDHYVQPGNLPEGFSGVWGAIDYVSGMSDTFAIRTFEELRVPRGF